MKSNPPIPLANTPVLILAGGLGTRLQSAVPDLPKGLAQIADKPFLEIQINLLKHQGAKEFVLCLGYMNEKVQTHFGDGSEFGVQIQYSIEKDKLLGTAGAVRNASHLIKNHALVLNGDTYFDIDYNEFVLNYLEMKINLGAKGILALSKAKNKNQFGNVRFDTGMLRLEGFSEKSDTQAGIGWVNAGGYILEKSLIESYIPIDIPCSIENEFFPDVINANEVLGVYLSENKFFDIGTPDSLKAFINFYAEKLHGQDKTDHE